MTQPDLLAELAHFRRISISQRLLAYLLCTGLFAFLGAGALFSSYLRMSREASQYEALRQNFDQLRARYHELQRIASQRGDQLASLQTLASAVSARYGITNPALQAAPGMKPSVQETIQEFNFLESAMVSDIYHHYAFQWQTHTRPSLWPVNGTLRSAFGGRPDPFSGEGEFHTGVDIAVPAGTPVHVTADGVVTSAGWSGSYGKLVIVSHGNGVETYYAHLSELLVVPGEEVRIGQVIALSGGTGRATAPHLHYEVRIAGTPVNPSRYLARINLPSPLKRHNDLGL